MLVKCMNLLFDRTTLPRGNATAQPQKVHFAPILQDGHMCGTVPWQFCHLNLVHSTFCRASLLLHSSASKAIKCKDLLRIMSWKGSVLHCLDAIAGRRRVTSLRYLGLHTCRTRIQVLTKLGSRCSRHSSRVFLSPFARIHLKFGH